MHGSFLCRRNVEADGVPSADGRQREGNAMTKPLTATAQPSRWALLSATALAVVAAAIYFVIGIGWVPDGFKSPPAPVMLVAGVAYLVGGGLILIAKRSLMLLGALANAVVLAIFVASVIAGNGTFDGLSLIGKVAQVLLEIFLVYFVVRMGARRATQGPLRTEKG